MYADTITLHVSHAVNQPIRQVREFAQIWDPEDWESISKIAEINSKEDRKRNALRQPRQATRVVRVPSVNLTFITVESLWFTQYVDEKLGRTYHY